MAAAKTHKILMVTREQEADRKYGLGRSIMALNRPLVANGFDLRYVCQSDLSASNIASRARFLGCLIRFPFIRKSPESCALIWAWGERLHMGFFAAKLAVNEGYRYVHMHDPWIAVGYLLYMLSHPSKRVHRWGVTQHGFGSYARAARVDGLKQGPFAQWVLKSIEYLVLKRAAWVITPTRLAMCQLMTDLKLDSVPAHWHVIPHARPDVAQIDKLEARKLLHWGKDDIVVVGVGRVVPLKRFDRLLKACNDLAQRYRHLRLVILGDGDIDPLLVQARNGELRHRFSIYSTSDTSLYLGAADIYVSTSISESFGLANLEALCAGLPAICTAAAAVPEVVGEGAYLINQDCAQLEFCLAKFIEDERLRRYWAERGKRHVAQWPDGDHVAAAYADVYLQS
ncbi:glycosyltransferase family 4 protein [Methyloparacoccus murrellii]